jgi:xanthosine utilization system XapX-like protein
LPGPQSSADFVNAAIGLASISEGLALGKVYLKQPFTLPGLAQPENATLAVVKYVGQLVDQKVVEAARCAEVICRQVASRPLAKANKVGSIFGKEFRVDAGKI